MKLIYVEILEKADFYGIYFVDMYGVYTKILTNVWK